MHYMILLPLLAVLGGGAGFFLRRWELSCAFDSQGLPIPGTPATICLVIFSAASAVVFFLFCLRVKRKADVPHAPLSACGNLPYLLLCLLDAALLPAAGLAGLLEELALWNPNPLRIALFILCFPICACIVLMAVRNFRGQKRQYSFSMLLPAFFCCLWLVTAGQACSADPVVLNYVYHLFAIICILLTTYYASSFSYLQTSPRLFLLFSLLGIYFGLTAMADRHDIAATLLLLFAVLYQLLHSTILLRRLFSPGSRPLHRLFKNHNSGGPST